MGEPIPKDILADLKVAARLHDRATADHARCMDFSRLMSDILSRLETAGCWDAADRVMDILLACDPKIGAHCDKAASTSRLMHRLSDRFDTEGE